jgi:hypothetical protein
MTRETYISLNFLLFSLLFFFFWSFPFSISKWMHEDENMNHNLKKYLENCLNPDEATASMICLRDPKRGKKKKKKTQILVFTGQESSNYGDKLTQPVELSSSKMPP